MLTSVRNAAAMPTPPPSANSRTLDTDRWANRPRYVRDLVWADDEATRMTLVVWTESAPPLPTPPANELDNVVALTTIQDNPHLF
jgi:hypothetical protein